MAFEILVALNVTDENVYTKYRAEMTPILKSYGGDFRYDFKVAETLKNGSTHAVNRVFTISFPDKTKKENFFADPNYLVVRKKFFDASVDGVTTIVEVNH